MSPRRAHHSSPCRGGRYSGPQLAFSPVNEAGALGNDKMLHGFVRGCVRRKVLAEELKDLGKMTPISTGGAPLWPGLSQVFGPLSIVSSTRMDAAHGVCQVAQSRRGAAASHVHLVNAYTVSLAAEDSAYAQLLTAGSINLPDGKPIALLSGLRQQVPRLHQVRGPQLFLDVFDVGRQYDLRHFLLGSSPEVLVRLSNALHASFPGCEIVGSESPAFRPLSDVELAEQDQRIRAARPDIIWVGLGTPKQDWEARRLVNALGITSVAVGAAFDFAAGTVKEAPAWIRKIGFEWLFRLCTQPRRLWRRYLIGNAKFLSVVLRDIYENGWRPRLR